MLYLIESGNYFKIGYTTDDSTLEKRLSSYSTHNPDYKLIATKEGSKEDEHNYHTSLSEYRLNGSEWFNKGDIFESVCKDFGIYFTNLREVDELDSEVYNAVSCIYNGSLIDIIMINDGTVYLHKHFKLYLTDYSAKSFTYDYDENGEYYSGLIINDELIAYDYRKVGCPANPVGYITTTDTPLYDKIKRYID